METCFGFQHDCPRNLQSEGSQGAEQGAEAALVFSCCERLSRALCPLPVLSVEKPAKQKSGVLGYNSQTIFKRVMLYCVLPFIYKECLAFMHAAVPAIHLVQNHARREVFSKEWTEAKRRGDKVSIYLSLFKFPLGQRSEFVLSVW